MTRSIALLIAATVLAGFALAATPSRSEAAITVGIGEQDASMFSDPLFTDLKIKRARYFPSWNVALKKREREWLDIWVSHAQRAGVEPFISFSQAVGSRCPQQAVQAAERQRVHARLQGVPQALAAGQGDQPLERGQPPLAADLQEPEAGGAVYNVVRARCKGCTIVAADVIDERNMESWLATFKRYAKSPKIWGLHNYRDTNLRKGQRTGGTARLLKTVKGKVLADRDRRDRQVRAAERGHAVQGLESRANTAIRRMFSLAKKYRCRIKRLYIYNWKQPDGNNRFDAGLVRKNGKARPATTPCAGRSGPRTFSAVGRLDLTAASGSRPPGCTS